MKSRIIRVSFIVFCFVIALGCGFVFPIMFHDAANHAVKLALALGEASTVLFGVFGVWLGLCYRDDIDTMTAGKRGDELRQTAEEVAGRTGRCEVLFKGLGITSLVFVASILVRSFEPAIILLCKRFWIIEVMFCAAIFGSVILLVFGILAPVIIMLHAMEKVRQAADSANETLRLTGRSSNK